MTIVGERAKLHDTNNREAHDISSFSTQPVIMNTTSRQTDVKTSVGRGFGGASTWLFPILVERPYVSKLRFSRWHAFTLDERRRELKVVRFLGFAVPSYPKV